MYYEYIYFFTEDSQITFFSGTVAKIAKDINLPVMKRIKDRYRETSISTSLYRTFESYNTLRNHLAELSFPPGTLLYMQGTGGDAHLPCIQRLEGEI